MHRKEERKEKAEEQQIAARREEIKALLPELHEEGRAIQPELIGLPQRFSPVLEAPSIFEGKREYVFLGLVLVLVSALVISALKRHGREAEMRVLAGTYLADEQATARMKMPALFETPSSLDSPFPRQVERKSDNAQAAPGPAELFFAQAPSRLAVIRKLLSEFAKGFDDTERRGILAKLHEAIVVLKTEASCWELRPAWQMSSALELLIKLLGDRLNEATPSTLRTIASAIDVLSEVCAPGVRPDLIITPPISVLAVDDNPLCLRAVVFALEKAGMTPQVSETGDHAVTLAMEKSYDVIFMDIQMPGIDGLTAAAQIREIERNEDTPVIFVTARSDFQTRAQTRLLGGTDLIAKPFLQFEITVKAITFAMRKRLQLAASLQRATALSSISRTEKQAA